MNRWSHFLFPSATAISLARFRVFFYSASLIFTFYYFFTSPGVEYPPELAQSNLLFGFQLPRISSGVYTAIFASTAVALFFCILGLGSYYSRAAVFLLSFYLFGYRYCYSMIHESDSALILSYFFLVFAPCNDAFSLDRRLGVTNRFERAKRDPRDYGWAVQFVRTYYIFIVFTAGCFKLYHSGWNWVSGDALSVILKGTLYSYYPFSMPVSSTTDFLIRNPFWGRAGSVFSLCVELAMPLVFFRREFRIVLLPAMIVLLLLIYFILHRSFIFSFAPLYIAWLPFESMATKRGTRR